LTGIESSQRSLFNPNNKKLSALLPIS